MILGISEATVKRIEMGIAKIPEKCSTGLEKLGLDPTDIAKQQEIFIAEKVKQLLERGKTRKG
jgi:hypothetical protein